MRIIIGNLHVFVTRHFAGKGWRVSAGQLRTDRRWCMEATELIPSMSLAKSVFENTEGAAQAFRSELLAAGVLVSRQDTRQDTQEGIRS